MGAVLKKRGHRYASGPSAPDDSALRVSEGVNFLLDACVFVDGPAGPNENIRSI